MRRLLAAAFLLAAAGCTRAVATTTATPPQSDTLTVLSTLTVAPEHLDAPAYNRDQWKHWLDVNGDGCDTRDDVLIAEATTPPAVGKNCKLTGGRWLSPYDQVAYTDPAGLDIDHLVALGEAHRSGGWQWDPDRKAEYANDVSDSRTLVAVTDSVNQAKGDKDPAGWLPAHDVCGYVAAWVAVKARWGLTVDAEEATALSDLLVGDCADT